MQRTFAYFQLIVMMNFVACSGRQAPHDSCTTGAFFQKQHATYASNLAFVEKKDYMPGGFLTFKRDDQTYRCNMSLTYEKGQLYLWTARHCLNFGNSSDYELQLWFGDGKSVTSGYQPLPLQNFSFQESVVALKATFDESLLNQDINGSYPYRRISDKILSAYSGIINDDSRESCRPSLEKVHKARDMNDARLPAYTSSRDDGWEDYQNTYCFSLDDIAVVAITPDTSKLDALGSDMLNKYQIFLNYFAEHNDRSAKITEYRNLLLEIGKQQRLYAVAHYLNQYTVSQCLS